MKQVHNIQIGDFCYAAVEAQIKVRDLKRGMVVKTAGNELAVIDTITRLRQPKNCGLVELTYTDDLPTLDQADEYQADDLITVICTILMAPPKI